MFFYTGLAPKDWCSRLPAVRMSTPHASDSEPCQKCQGDGWVWRHELDDTRDWNGVTDHTKYVCDRCFGHNVEVSLQGLATILETTDPKDESGSFGRAISLSFRLIPDLTDQEVAHRFDMARSSVSRWRAGRNSPHPAMRTSIYKWFAERARERL